MKCEFCHQSALAGKPITVSGIGIAHESCYERHLIEQRVFKTLNLRQLNETELSELHDLVQIEMNARKPVMEEIEIW
ncbi:MULTISPECIES: hypothetical protein [Thalassolituus]|jgi:hypothetical protein|uniref:DUF2175 domain-containing protein n=2 Tax=Thalassolituus TaxID=187492 RepID=A0A9X2WCR5_9GAMM|nr:MULTISPECIES: hypothetical protein [Thalassolituus]MCT7357915.1 hypothetical protein [Thalassolituus pacificus]UXD87011.1 hypothetical protein HUF19_05945 [Thalassolituus hydrocarboniclasticus]